MSDDVLFRSLPKFHREEDDAIDARVYFVVALVSGRSDLVSLRLVDERGAATNIVSVSEVSVSVDRDKTRSNLFLEANKMMAQYQQVDHFRGLYL